MSRNKYVVAFNTNEGYPDSWFAAFDSKLNQLFTHAEAKKLRNFLKARPSSNETPIQAMILHDDHPQVVINPRTNYVRII